MKILKPGNTVFNPDPKFRWVGKCEKCGCEFECSGYGVVLFESRWGGPKLFIETCPTPGCFKTVGVFPKELP